MGQSKHDTEVQLGAPMSFDGVIYRNVCEDLLTAAEMTPRQLGHKVHPVIPDS